MNTFLTVDPGDKTGWALFDDRYKRPRETGEIKVTPTMVRELKIEEKLKHQWAQFDNLIGYTNKDLDHVYIEGTRVYGGSQISMISAVRGDLINLTLMIGGYAAICNEHNVPFSIITASKWKGQLTKEATAAQVLHVTGEKYASEHITDAVGIGLHVLGLLPIGRGKK